MEYWEPGLPDEMHVHTECFVKNVVDDIMKRVEEKLKEVKR